MRTSWLLCQLALSQIRSSTSLPLSWSLWQLHWRNCVVMMLTGLPSTNLSHVSLSSGRYTVRSRRESLRLGIVLSRLLLEEAHRMARLLPGMHRGSLEAAEPGFILKAQNPLRMGLGEPDQPISTPFFGHTQDPGFLSSVWPSPNAPQALPGWLGWSLRLPASRLDPPRS